MDGPGLAEELLLALLQGNGVDDAFALSVFQTLENRVPVRGVYHHRGPCNVRLAGDVPQEGAHPLRGVEHRVVHIDVDDRRSALYLGGSDGERLAVFLRSDKFRELARTRDVGPFSYVGEVAAPVDQHRLQSAYREGLAGLEAARGKPLHRFRQSLDVLRSGAAAASDYVQQSSSGQLAHDPCHKLRRIVVAPHFIGNAGVGIETHGVAAETCDLRDERGHHVRAEGAVDAEGAERRRVLNRAVECLEGLSCQRTPAPVRDRRGNDEGQGIAEKFEGIDSRLGVQRVEAGLKYDEVGAAAHESIDFLTIRIHEIVEAILPVCGVVGVRGQGKGLARGPDAAGDIDLAAGGVGHAACADRGLIGQVRRQGRLPLLRE